MRDTDRKPMNDPELIEELSSIMVRQYAKSELVRVECEGTMALLKQPLMNSIAMMEIATETDSAKSVPD